MPTPLVKVSFKGKTISVPIGSNLRSALLKASLNPHNGKARWLNCKGFGTCGTCAIELEGAVSEPTKTEKWRLNFPPHQAENKLRLACQCQVQGDLKLKKHPGFWGEKIA
jgi:ferredoxin